MGESGNRPGVENKQELNISSPEIIFGVDADFEEHIGSLEEAYKSKDPDTVKKLLGNNKFVENIVIKKGDKKEWLQFLDQAINIISQTEIGKGMSAISDFKELARIIESAKLSPFAVAELAGAYYHLERDEECERLAKLISEFKGLSIDLTSRANAFNTLGSLYLRQGSVEGSVEANKAGLTLLANENEDFANVKWQKTKLKYGILIDRMEQGVSSDMPEQLLALKRERIKSGDVFNISRVDLDVAKAFAALNKRDQAIRFALDAKDGMTAVGYWSGAAQAEELCKTLINKKKKR